MTEPLGLQAILIGAMSGAGIVMFGACYALFFALGRLNRSRMYELAGLAGYALLAVCCYGLVRSLELEGFWIAVVAVMLIGYFVAPRAIWHLCVGTHGEATEPVEPPLNTRLAP
ncbi:MAG: hypothetical protein R3200_03065 [Xanthomonadales bacterium]|nr:hypothetical protein [Xanthomonadales bacterium]